MQFFIPAMVADIIGRHDWLPCAAQDYLETNDEQVYSGTSYTTLEISPRLAAMQQRKVTANGRHQQCFSVVQQDALTSLAWDAPAEQPCVILMMEVLDNMPHDRYSILLAYCCCLTCRHASSNAKVATCCMKYACHAVRTPPVIC